MTRVLVRQGAIQEAKADAIVVNLFKGTSKLGGATAAVDAALDGAIQNLLELGDFKGKLKDLSVLATNGKLPAKRVILVGLGEKAKFGVDEARMVSARVATWARDHSLNVLATIVHGAGAGGMKAEKAAFALVEGALLGLYEYREYKSEPKREEGEEPEPKRQLQELHVIEAEARRVPAIEAAAREAEALAQITNDVRTVVNRPSMDKTPPILAQTALDWAKKYGFSAKVLEKPELERLKMGGILGVGAGSQHPPRLVVLEKKGRGPRAKTILLVGKGITFDSGGISIKPANGMDLMRHDMAGAAAVLGALCAAAHLDIPHHVIGLLPLAENMPSGTAIRPGDILRAYDGTTIEVLNTDAEGRLVLADALGYGLKKYEPDAVIDIATLTGSVKVALGTIVTGLFSNDDRLSQRLVEAGRRVGDALWRMPLTSEYAAHIKSDYADIKNTGTNWGGSITAAAFLGHFVGDAKWAHLDIAGTCWTDKGGGDLRNDYHAKGATGVGVRLFTELLRSWK